MDAEAARSVAPRRHPDVPVAVRVGPSAGADAAHGEGSTVVVFVDGAPPREDDVAPVEAR